MSIWRPSPRSGISGPHEGYRWSRDAGGQVTRRYQGRYTDLVSIVPALKVDAAEVYISDADTEWRELVAIYNDERTGVVEEPATTWELTSVDDQKPLWDSYAYSTLSDEDQQKLRAAFKDQEDGTLNTFPVFDDPAVAEALLEVAGHANAFIDDYFVLRRVDSIRNQSQIALSFTGIGETWTTAQVIAAESTMWAGIAAGMQAIPEPSARSGYLWGWLKRKPSLIQKARASMELQQDWILAQWPLIIYPAH